MGTISSGVGLISGLDINTLVNGLLAVDAKPRDLLQQRIDGFNSQSTALMTLSAQVSGILSRISSLMNSSTFNAVAVNSSASTVLAASVGAGAPPAPGNYSFFVKALATTHQLISRGVASSSAALSPGTLTLESAQARVNTGTALEMLNGFTGVARGSIKLTDASGKQATVDLSDALTVADVLDRINAAGLNVRASVKGDSLTLSETTGGAIRVDEVNGGRTAADLGFDETHSFSSTGGLVGKDVVSVNGSTALSQLNDGLGIRTAKAGADFTINDIPVDVTEILKDSTSLQRLNHGDGVGLGVIRVKTTDAAGQTVTKDIDLSGATTVGDVHNKLTAAMPGVTVSLSSGHFILGYSDGKARKISIEDVSGHAARDLGLANSSDTGKITGADVLQVRTLADVAAAINYAEKNDGTVKATVTDSGLQLDSTTPLRLVSLNGSKTLSDLGFQDGASSGDQLVGARLIGGLNSVLLKSLNGGAGVAAGTISVSTGGASFNVDLSQAQSLNDVLDAINQAAQSNGNLVSAQLDSTGTKLLIRSGDGSTPVAISDVSGNFASVTGINQPSASITGANLQRRYISENTKLSDLNQGRGVTLGKFKITDSSGIATNIDLTVPPAQSMQDVINAINNSGARVKARINDTGDGLLLSDSAGGALGIKVEENGGTIAHDLNILGTSATNTLDGSYELHFDVAAGDSLDTLVQRINDKGLLGQAAVLYDGGTNGYRLHLTSDVSGSRGELLVSDSIGLGMSTLTAAQDARVLIGSDASSGVLVRSSSNTITNAVPGLTLDLQSVSDTPVNVTVAQNTDTLTTALQGFVDSMNSALGLISQDSSYDPDTQKAGILLGDSTLQRVQDRLIQLVNRDIPGASGSIHRLSQLGITLKDGQLSFDSAKFGKVYAASPKAVTDFFTNATSGAGAYLKKQLESITDSSKGLIVSRTNVLAKTVDSLTSRIGDMNTLLDLKRTRLLTQFNAMESTLAQLKSQQSALAQIGSISSSSSSSSSSG